MQTQVQVTSVGQTKTAAAWATRITPVERPQTRILMPGRRPISLITRTGFESKYIITSQIGSM